MTNEGVYSFNAITQIPAMRDTLFSTEDLILENYLKEHTRHQMNGREPKKAIKEILEVYKLAKKK